MQELNEIATRKIKDMIDNGSIETMIHENIEKTMDDIVKSSLRTYGDFGKALEESVKEAMCIAGRKISLPEYNKFIMEVVNDQFLNVLEKNALENLTEVIAEVIEPVQKEMKISVLMDKIEKSLADVALEHGSEEIEIEAEYNDDDTAIHVTIKHPEYDWEHLRVTFYNFNRGKEERNTWHIGYIREGDKRITGRSIKRANTHLDELSGFLFKCYAMGTEFELDTEIESIYVGH